jgi:hypothetical protein
MVSPEPDFWIHAVRDGLALLECLLLNDLCFNQCVELAKIPRPPIDKEKEKSKGKGKEKAETKQKGNEERDKQTPVAYDYHDGSINSLAVRSSILCGYEQFKVWNRSHGGIYVLSRSVYQLTHGSFTRILSTLGKEALELQLERFFTVWAWSWNLEDGHEFGPHLGQSIFIQMNSVLSAIHRSASTSAPPRAQAHTR